MAKATTPWLLEVEVVILDSTVNAVLARDGVTSRVVSVCPGPGLLTDGQFCIHQRFRLRNRVCDCSTAGADGVCRFRIYDTGSTNMRVNVSQYSSAYFNET